jgi:hypothetical protein
MYIQSVVDSEEKSLQDFALFKSAPGQNTVINSLCKLCHWPTHTDRFSLKFAFTGAETYYVRHRKLTVERNRLLVVNAGQPYAGTVRSVEWVQCLAIYFAPSCWKPAASNLSDEAAAQQPLRPNESRGVVHTSSCWRRRPPCVGACGHSSRSWKPPPFPT